jgi:hypothetical protein
VRPDIRNRHDAHGGSGAARRAEIPPHAGGRSPNDAVFHALDSPSNEWVGADGSGSPGLISPDELREQLKPLQTQKVHMTCSMTTLNANRIDGRTVDRA